MRGPRRSASGCRAWRRGRPPRFDRRSGRAASIPCSRSGPRPIEAFFEARAEEVAHCCHRMAERFARGGRLISLGLSPAARSDVRHVAVEFVHPVIVGKRALPAIGLSREGGPLTVQVELIAEPDDIVIAFGTDEPGRRRDRSRRSDWPRRAAARRSPSPPAAPSGSSSRRARTRSSGRSSPRRSTTCSGSWSTSSSSIEACSRAGRRARSTTPGASSFLYPFLSEGETGLEA